MNDVTLCTCENALVSETSGEAVIVPQNEGFGVAGEEPVTVVDAVAVNVPNEAVAVPELALDCVTLAVFELEPEVDNVDVDVTVRVFVSVDFELVVEDEEAVLVGEEILDVEDELEGEDVSEGHVVAVVEGVTNADIVMLDVDVDVTVYDTVPIELREKKPLALLAPERDFRAVIVAHEDAEAQEEREGVPVSVRDMIAEELALRLKAEVDVEHGETEADVDLSLDDEAEALGKVDTETTDTVDKGVANVVKL
jgi:hypothetical protein